MFQQIMCAEVATVVRKVFYNGRCFIYRSGVPFRNGNGVNVYTVNNLFVFSTYIIQVIV